MKKKTMLLLMILPVLIIVPKVKAYEIGEISAVHTSTLFGGQNFNTTSWSTQIESNGGYWASWGKGQFIFTATTYCNYEDSGTSCSSGDVLGINAVTMQMDGYRYTCDIGNQTSYNDNTAVYNTYTIKCLANRSGDSNIVVNFYHPYESSGSYRIRLSEDMTFVQYITTDTQVETKLEENKQAINEQTQQQEENHNEIMNADISEETKESADTSQATTMEDTQQDIYDTLFTNAPNPLDVLSFTIDTESNAWIWNTMQSLINTHARILGMIVTILSIGLAKMILGR